MLTSRNLTFTTSMSRLHPSACECMLTHEMMNGHAGKHTDHIASGSCDDTFGCGRFVPGPLQVMCTQAEVRTEADRLRHVHEQIVYLQGQINNRMYDATQAMHRLQMTWQQLAEWWLPPRKHHLRWKIPGDEPPQALPQDSQDYRIYAASLVLYISYTCL